MSLLCLVCHILRFSLTQMLLLLMLKWGRSSLKNKKHAAVIEAENVRGGILCHMPTIDMRSRAWRNSEIEYNPQKHQQQRAAAAASFLRKGSLYAITCTWYSKEARAKLFSGISRPRIGLNTYRLHMDTFFCSLTSASIVLEEQSVSFCRIHLVFSVTIHLGSGFFAHTHTHKMKRKWTSRITVARCVEQIVFAHCCSNWKLLCLANTWKNSKTDRSNFKPSFSFARHEEKDRYGGTNWQFGAKKRRNS